MAYMVMRLKEIVNLIIEAENHELRESYIEFII